MVFVLSGCGRKDEKVTMIPVSAKKVTKGDIVQSLHYVGDIKAREQVNVYPKVTGKLMENTVKEQQKVTKGDAIAYVDRDEIGFEFEKAPVESPIDGIVGRVYLDKGESVSPNVAVAQIVNMDVVKVRVNIVERDIPKVKEGKPAKIRVDAYPGEVFKGMVERVSPVVDLASRTAMVEINIPNSDHRLKPGMFARVNILIDEKKGVLIVPRDAGIRDGSLCYVFVVEDGKARRRKIELGVNEDNRFEAIKGLEEGMIVVTMGNTVLKEGDRVEVMTDPGIREIREGNQ